MMTGAPLPARQVPRLPRSPLIGNLIDLHRDRLGLLRRVLEQLGEAGCFHLGPRPIYVFTSPRYAAEVLIQDWSAFEKGPMVRRFARPFLGDGLISCSTAAHPRKRRLVAPAFARPRIARYADMMAEVVSATMDSWPVGRALDFYGEIRRTTMRTICRALFSVDPDAEATALGEACDIAAEHISTRLENPFHPPRWVPTAANRRVNRAVVTTDEFISKLIADRRRTGGDHGDVLSALLEHRDESGDALSDKELLDDLKSLFHAGYETATNTLAFACGFLAQRPDMLDRIAGEVRDAVDHRRPTLDDLPRLPFTLQVVQETLRIFPAVHTIGRQLPAPHRVGEYLLPAGAILLVSPYLMHRLPALYPDPERFDPERFAAGMRAARPKLAYLPYGAGPRVCIGAHFAQVEMHLFVAMLAARYRLVPSRAGDPVPDPLMTLRPRGGLSLRLERREEA